MKKLVKRVLAIALCMITLIGTEQSTLFTVQAATTNQAISVIFKYIGSYDESTDSYTYIAEKKTVSIGENLKDYAPESSLVKDLVFYAWEMDEEVVTGKITAAMNGKTLTALYNPVEDYGIATYAAGVIYTDENGKKYYPYDAKNTYDLGNGNTAYSFDANGDGIGEILVLDGTNATGQANAFVLSGYKVIIPWENEKEQYTKVKVNRSFQVNSNAQFLFRELEEATQIDVSELNTSSITNMQYMFSGCYNLTTIDLSSFNTSKVTNMDGMFEYCYDLSTLDLNSFDTNKVTDMASMFRNCTSLTTLDVSNFDTSKVKSMQSMFRTCNKLTSLDLSNFDTTNVTDMIDMFNGCKNLTTLDISSFDLSNVTSYSSLFSYVTKLTTLKTPKINSYTDITFDITLPVTLYDKNNNYKAYTSLPVTTGTSITLTELPYIYKDENGKKYYSYDAKDTYDLGNGNLGYSFDANGDGTGEVLVLDGTDSTGQATTSRYYLWKEDQFTKVKVNRTFQVNSNAQSLFNGLSNVTSIDASEFDTSKVTDMSDMFEGCKKLTSLDVSNFDTSNVTTMYKMFYNCNNLTTIDVSHFDTSKVTNMKYMFYKCENLKSLYLSKLDTSNVTDMASMFAFCENLTSLDLNNWNTSKVTNMHGMFNALENVTSLDLSDFDTSKVTDMGWMFSSCSSLTTLDLSTFDTSNVTDMENMFWYCSKLTTLDISNFALINVTSYSSMFQSCKKLITFKTPKINSLTGIYLPVTLYDASDEYRKYTALPVTTGTSKELINDYAVYTDEKGNEYYQKDAKDTYNLSNKNYGYSFDVDGDGTGEVLVLDGKNATGQAKTFDIMVGSANIPWKNEVTQFTKVKVNASFRVNSNAYGLFYALENVTSIDISNFDTSNVTDMSSMFKGCKNLTSLDLSNFETSKVTKMGGMFDECSNLTTLDLSNFDTSKVTDMYNMFSECTSLITLDLRTFDTSNVTAMFGMFWECTSLANLDVSHFDTSNVTTMQYLFYHCKSLTSLDLSNWNTSKVTNMHGMFNGCSSLTTLDLSTFDTSNVTDMENMFRYCSKLTTLDISNFALINVTSYSSMFYDCAKLITLKAPKNNPITNIGLPVTLYDKTNNYKTYTALPVTTGASSTLVNTAPVIYKSLLGKKYYPYDAKNTYNFGNGNYGYSFDVNRDGVGEVLVFDGTDATEQSTLQINTDAEIPWRNEKTQFTKVKVNTSFKPNEKSSYLFAYLENVTSMDLSGLDTSKIIKANLMFYHCKSLTSLDVSNFNTSKMDDMNGMFAFCESLTTLDLSNWNTSKVTDMAGMFDHCLKLTNLNINNFDISKVSNMAYFLNYCQSLTTLDISNFDLTNVSNYGFMFKEMNNLTIIKTPRTNPHADIDFPIAMHDKMDNYKSYRQLPVTNNESKELVKEFVVYTDNQNRKYFPKDAKKIYSLGNENYVYSFDTDGDGIGETLVYDGYDAIGQASFISSDTIPWTQECSQYTKVKVNRTFQVNNHATYLFANLTNVTEMDLSELNTSNVTEMGWMFNGCSSLITLDISNFITGNVLDMEFMFNGCKSLTTLDINNFDTSKVYAMSYMFNDCESLISLDISNFNTSKVETMTMMFNNCKSLTNIDVSHFNMDKLVSTVFMFGNCEKITTLDISNFDMTNIQSHYAMLSGCSALTKLKTPKVNPYTDITLPVTLYDASDEYRKYTALPVTAGTSITLEPIVYNYTVIAPVSVTPQNNLDFSASEVNMTLQLQGRIAKNVKVELGQSSLSLSGNTSHTSFGTYMDSTNQTYEFLWTVPTLTGDTYPELHLTKDIKIQYAPMTYGKWTGNIPITIANVN